MVAREPGMILTNVLLIDGEGLAQQDLGIGQIVATDLDFSQFDKSVPNLGFSITSSMPALDGECFAQKSFSLSVGAMLNRAARHTGQR